MKFHRFRPSDASKRFKRLPIENRAALNGIPFLLSSCIRLKMQHSGISCGMSCCRCRRDGRTRAHFDADAFGAGQSRAVGRRNWSSRASADGASVSHRSRQGNEAPLRQRCPSDSPIAGPSSPWPDAKDASDAEAKRRGVTALISDLLQAWCERAWVASSGA